MESKRFSVNQIVKARSGIFMVLGYRLIENELYCQVKEVNPNNYQECARGEIALPQSILSEVSA